MSGVKKIARGVKMCLPKSEKEFVPRSENFFAEELKTIFIKEWKGDMTDDFIKVIG